MRRKETADDYRYFHEPDLPPLILDEAYIDAIRETLPELPYERARRYIAQYEIAPDLATILINDKLLADYFEAALKICSNAKSLGNWMVVEFAGRLKDKGLSLPQSGITAQNIAKLVNLIDSGVITGKIAKMVADAMVASPEKDCEEIVKGNPPSSRCMTRQHSNQLWTRCYATTLNL